MKRLSGIPTRQSNPDANGSVSTVVDDGSAGDSLFPSVAFSDAINALAHAAAACIVLPISLYAAIGFSLVAVAAAFGTARFGFSARIFRPANESVAELAAFIGLPLVGFAVAAQFVNPDLVEAIDPTIFVVTLATVGALARGLPKEHADAVRTAIVAPSFIIPVVWNDITRGDAVMVREGAGHYHAVLDVATCPPCKCRTGGVRLALCSCWPCRTPRPNFVSFWSLA